ncbi:MAG: DsrE family protein [Halothiobacillaceae bacterium]|nr:DsrE family protein [Halothiobacillaceae bacterium]
MLLRNLIIASVLGLAFPLFSNVALAEDASSTAAAPIKVVYHVSEGVQQASRAIGNIRNQLKTDPSTKIVVVAHGAGIDFLLEDAENASGSKFAPAIEELKAAGVEFRVCNNTLMSRKIDPKSVVEQASIVPSGVVEVSTLQAREGFVYLKP